MARRWLVEMRGAPSSDNRAHRLRAAVEATNVAG